LHILEQSKKGNITIISVPVVQFIGRNYNNKVTAPELVPELILRLGADYPPALQPTLTSILPLVWRCPSLMHNIKCLDGVPTRTGITATKVKSTSREFGPRFGNSSKNNDEGPTVVGCDIDYANLFYPQSQVFGARMAWHLFGDPIVSHGGGGFQ
jgi:hypothetical protein